MDILIDRETPDQPEILEFLRRADERSSRLYPSASRPGPSLAALLAPPMRFFVARTAGEAVGCGGYAIGDDGAAELKRVFVDPRSRGRGVGLAIIRALEASARREGVKTMQLETGIKSSEAIGLYKRLGYRERGPFGSYARDEFSVFMEKDLSALPFGATRA